MNGNSPQHERPENEAPPQSASLDLAQWARELDEFAREIGAELSAIAAGEAPTAAFGETRFTPTGTVGVAPAVRAASSPPPRPASEPDVARPAPTSPLPRRNSILERLAQIAGDEASSDGSRRIEGRDDE